MQLQKTEPTVIMPLALFFIFIAIFEYARLFEIERIHDKQIQEEQQENEITIGGE